MENIEKGLTVPKLINRPKIPQNLSAQIVCPRPKLWDFDEKKASLGVHGPCTVQYVCVNFNWKVLIQGGTDNE